ncbi:mechanosensitive ion channel family protein [Jannaschia sp. LMIT008]|uniref:mechanosensitive ion channel family protein n=1 Tax=Jannaschia maritima TaxID=3032585 RepID=UPI0028126659|nr:mechanosensitive ion channel family protein [Jannaschia sp. LMIT008]
MDDEARTQVDADPGLILQKLDEWVDGFFRLLPNIVVALVLFALFVGLAWFVAWSVRHSVRSKSRADLAAVLGSVAKWLVIATGLLLSLTVVTPSLRPGDLIAGLGLGSLAIGYAFKDILQNLLAGIVILYRQPFRDGDQIVVDGDEGTVEHIETRATKIRTYDGRRVVVPNYDIFTGAVIVNTAFEARRTQADFPIGLDEDWARAVEVARDAAMGAAGVVDDPSADAQAQEVADFAKVVRVRWWSAPAQKDVIATASNVRLAVERALRDAGFTLPDRRAIHVRNEDGAARGAPDG